MRERISGNWKAFSPEAFVPEASLGSGPIAITTKTAPLVHSATIHSRFAIQIAEKTSNSIKETREIREICYLYSQKCNAKYENVPTTAR
jgi:hypothetical protein